ncbi:MAG: CorA family divalent cation transporter [Akkermansia sp.]
MKRPWTTPTPPCTSSCAPEPRRYVLSEYANFLSSNVNFMLDAVLGLINIEQNEIVKIFTVAAVVFMPPTLIASIYGMNFAHMPGLENEYGYYISLVVMLVSIILPLVYFRSRRLL